MTHEPNGAWQIGDAEVRPALNPKIIRGRVVRLLQEKRAAQGLLDESLHNALGAVRRTWLRKIEETRLLHRCDAMDPVFEGLRHDQQFQQYLAAIQGRVERMRLNASALERRQHAFTGPGR